MTNPVATVVPRPVACDVGAVVLLAGRVGPAELGRGVRRNVLDLPVDDRRRLLDAWAERLEALARANGHGPLRVLLAIDQASSAPRLPAETAFPHVRFEVVRDATEYRGTAGVVKDAIVDVPRGAHVLVATASQIVREPIERVLSALNGASEGVGLVPHRGSDFAALFLLHSSRFDSVPDVGFMDLKEQALPEPAEGRRLAVVRRPEGASLPIRTRDEYIRALRTVHAANGAARAAVDPFEEEWQPRFSIVEEGAEIAPSAVVQDSVVLAGARVEDGAVVARSVVCPGGVVRSRGQAVETIVVAG